jgi:hypothetical protein
MIFILFIPFLMLGCTAFLICAAVPPIQRFALGVSLWCVAWIPGMMAILTVVIFFSVGADALRRWVHWDPGASLAFNHHGLSWAGWLGFSAAILVVALGASVISLIHGIVMRRLTLSLFRLYLAGVSFCVGMLSFGFLAFAFAEKVGLVDHAFAAWSSCLLFATALSYLCFRNAERFRGSYPKTLPIVTHEEFGANP